MNKSAAHRLYMRAYKRLEKLAARLKKELHENILQHDLLLTLQTPKQQFIVALAASDDNKVLFIQLCNRVNDPYTICDCANDRSAIETFTTLYQFFCDVENRPFSITLD